MKLELKRMSDLSPAAKIRLPKGTNRTMEKKRKKEEEEEEE